MIPLQGCREKTDTFNPNPKEWSALRSTDYGYTRMQVVNATHLYLEQVSDDQVRTRGRACTQAQQNWKDAKGIAQVLTKTFLCVPVWQGGWQHMGGERKAWLLCLVVKTAILKKHLLLRKCTLNLNKHIWHFPLYFIQWEYHFMMIIYCKYICNVTVICCEVNNVL